jgi:carbon-monoxide dehydrogenase small subunit
LRSHSTGCVAYCSERAGGMGDGCELILECRKDAIVAKEYEGETQPVALMVNGAEFSISVEPRKTLADAIREDCGLTGTHLGCEQGACGACTVLLDGEPVRSCLLFAVQCEGSEIRTVEGLANGDQLHPIQQAFWEHHALQCGFCTPGFLMLVLYLYEAKARPTDEELRRFLASNLCRCTGYLNIVEAARSILDNPRV